MENYFGGKAMRMAFKNDTQSSNPYATDKQLVADYGSAEKEKILTQVYECIRDASSSENARAIQDSEGPTA